MPPVDLLAHNASGVPLPEWRDAGVFPNERFRFAGSSTESALYLFGGQNKFDAASGTYPLTDESVEFREGCPSVRGAFLMPSCVRTFVSVSVRRRCRARA